MPEGPFPVEQRLPDGVAQIVPDPLVLRLEDLPSYGSREVEPSSQRMRWLIAGGLIVAILMGAFLGLRPWYLRRELRATLDRQIAAGEFVAGQTTLDRFAAAFPTHPDLPCYAGQVLLGQAKFTEAEAALAPHVARFPDDVQAGMSLGYIYGVDQILRAVPVEETDLRKGMLIDWTRLFGLTVAGAGFDPSLPSLTLANDSTVQGLAVLRRTLNAEGADQATLQGAIAALELLSAETPETQTAAFDRMQTTEGINLPSFQAYLSLIAQPAPELAAGPPIPPLVGLPPTEGMPQAPAPGDIVPLDGSEGGSAYEPMPSPALPIPGRGAGALAGAFETPDGPTSNGAAMVLSDTGGRGPAPRIRPVSFDSLIKVEFDGREEVRWYTQLINIDEAGNQRLFVGDEVKMPMTGWVVKVRSIDAEKRRIVLEEKDRGVYVWVKPPGAKWFWDTSDEENDFGGLRKAKYGTEQQ